MLHLHQIFTSIWAITDTQAVNYIPLITSYMKGNRIDVLQERPKTFALASIENGAYQVQPYGRNKPEEIPENSLAIIDIRGAITKYDQDCGPDGMLTQSNLLKRCYNADNIKAVVLRIDSGGGQAMAMRTMIDAIKLKNKPVVAFIEDCAGSAAYGIASACDYIIANQAMAQVGSIGSMGTIFDYQKALKKAGIKEITEYAPQSTNKNSWYRKAIAGDTTEMKQLLSDFAEYFIKEVEENRAGKLKSDRTEWGKGDDYYAAKALGHGLIDGIDNFENVLNYFNT